MTQGHRAATPTRWPLVLLLALVLLPVALAGAGRPDKAPADEPTQPYLTGQLLVAAPGLRDPNFAKSVVLMVHHDQDGAFGLIVNRPTTVAPASKLLQLITGKKAEQDSDRNVRVHYGGPVQKTRWFFIHSSDYESKQTKRVANGVSLTNHPDILRALVKGEGPAKGFLTLGYAGWGPGQLESEIARDDWVSIAPKAALVLDEDKADVWHRAFEMRGVDL